MLKKSVTNVKPIGNRLVMHVICEHVNAISTTTLV
jgi:hypothetical protein